MKVVLAEKAGFCFGVKRAVDQALESQKKHGKRTHTLGPLIHNNDVINYLEENDIHPIEIEDVDSLEPGDVVIIRSHGVTPEVLEKLRDKGLVMVDATCPYVANIQKKVKKYHDLGYGIVIVGDKNHPEVIGINGWCENSAIISKDGEDIENLPNRVCVVSQTTEKMENWEKVLNKIVRNCKEIVACNTICSATEVRQKAAAELSANVDMMVVIGGKNSSNTTKLYEICKERCKNTIHVENSGEIPDEISKNIKFIGVTAGASTPDWIIKEAIVKMNEDKMVEMNEQLAYMEQNDVKVAVGDIVKGKVISVNAKEAFLNIGAKGDALLPASEVSNEEEADLKEKFNVGDEIESKVVSLRNSDGYIVLSIVEIAKERACDEIKEAFENHTVLNVAVKEVVNGGVVASYKGARVFVPASHLELSHVDDLSAYVGKNLEVSIINFETNKRGNKIVASRRELLSKEREKKEEATWSSIEEGSIVEGEVKRLSSFGAFVDVNGVDGLLHVSEISWGRVNKPSDVLKPGQKIKVYVLAADKEKRKLSLSIKALSPDPWKNIAEKYPAGSIVLGKVARFASFGAFIELEPGVDGLVHISQISFKRIEKPENVLEIGESVKAKILEVNEEGKRISLSIKEAEEI